MHTEKSLSPCVLVLQVGCIAGLESLSEEIQLNSDVLGVLLDIVGRDHSMICRQKEDA